MSGVYFKPLRTLALLLLMNFLLNTVTAQTVTTQKDSFIFKTDYNKNDELFPVGDDDVKLTYVQNGVYYMKLKDASQNYRVYYKVVLDLEKDFTVLTTVQHFGGAENKWYGMTFGYKDLDNAAYFVIRDDGKFEVYKYVSGKKYSLIEPTETSYVSSDKYNVLCIQKMNDKLFFFINYKMVGSVPYYKLPESRYGLYISGEQEIASDYFYVKQKRDPINLIEGWNKFGVVTKLGGNINSKKGEISPVVSADENYLFVTRKPYFEDKDKDGDDDIYFAKLGLDSQWKALNSIGKPLNNEKHNFVCGVSSDNDELMIGGKYIDGKWVGSGFSRSHRTATGWSTPKALLIKNYYNDDKYVEMCPSHDFKRIILAIKRKDTYGEKDLYTSVMLSDSTWSEPVNLGKLINSFGEEDSPFLAPDNVTLYFSSNGWPGYGSNDIFMTRRLDDTWKNWSKPKNLGPIINSEKWDAYYTTSASGKKAYLVRNLSDDNHADIYEVKQPESAKPVALMMVKGTVYNEKTKKPVKAMITYSILGSNVTAGRTTSDENGEFSITFNKGKKYAFTAHKEGFIAEHKSSDVVDLKRYQEVDVELYLTPFEKGQSVIMHNLFFVPDKYEILPESAAELDRLYGLLKDNPKVKVEIGGHTSINRSSEKWNMELSSNRANAVKEYLINKGVSADRVTSKGYGHSKPLETNLDEEFQAKNRRVEFTIIEK